MRIIYFYVLQLDQLHNLIEEAIKKNVKDLIRKNVFAAAKLLLLSWYK